MPSPTGKAFLVSIVILAMRATTLACKLGLTAFVGSQLDLSALGVGDYLGAFALIMAAMALRNIADVGAMGLFTARRDHVMTVTIVSSVIALAVAQAVLLPLAGLNGAGAAIMIAFAAMISWRHQLLSGFRAQPAQSRS
jgi:O-antigen/teichoic acid export membrane protein